MSEKELKALIRKRGSLKGKLTNFKSYLNDLQSTSLLNDYQLTEFQLRLNKIEIIYDEFDILQTEIETLADPDSQSEAPDSSARRQFEDDYYSTISAARVLIESYNKKSFDGQSEVSSISAVGKVHTHSFVNLPKIDLPHFEGGYHSWLEFRDTYVSLIHTNDSINTINKFHYLRASLKGSAALMIQSLDLRAENYQIAWQLLSERYDNEKLLVTNHVNALFNVEQIHKESSKALRNIIDVTNKNLRALATLGQPTDHWDTLVIHIMSSKLDSVTYREWEERRNSISSPPNLSFFLKFLANRSDFLETLEESKANRLHKQEVFSSSFSKPKSLIASSSFDKNKKSHYTCPLCKKEHNLFMCTAFRSLPVETRIQKAKLFKVCLNCLCHGHTDNKCRLSHCKYCKQKHNTLLHSEALRQQEPTAENVALPTNITSTSNNVALSVKTSSSTATSNYVLLSTALVKVLDRDGNLHTARILLDNASTTNFVTQEFCSKLNLQTSTVKSKVTGINSHMSRSSKSCSMYIQSIDGTFKINIDCFVLPNITTNIPSTYIESLNINIPSGVSLADPSYNMPSAINILVGAEVFWMVLGTNRIQLGKNQPSLYETKLGWLVSGSIRQPKDQSSVCLVSLEDRDLSVDISRFWELDTVPFKHTMTPDERFCEESFKNNTTRDSSGRFIVTVPLKESPTVLGESYQRAMAQFLSLERRLQRNPKLKELYTDFLVEYKNLGHMSLSKYTANSNTNSYFLPHHGVINEASTTTKLRVVFNASSPTSTRKSFNDIQAVGPTVQDDLLSILLRFRQHLYVVTADIEKMYRQIYIAESQRSLQQIIWRSNPSESIKTYTLNTVTYGTASAPYLATRCLTQLGYEASNNDVKHAICHDFYVDDFLSGRDTIEDTIALCNGVVESLQSAKFKLRKWHSNSEQILKNVSDDHDISNSVNLCANELSKTLGLLWNCSTDSLTFSIHISLTEKINKRAILSTIAQVFDPLGLVSPCIVEAKIIMQQLWIIKCSWDEEVPEHIKKTWCNFVKSLPYLNNLAIPRCIKLGSTLDVTMHTFTDASEKAYGACIYVRTLAMDGSVNIRLLASKSKVAPLKPQATTPRLELCGALLGAKLCHKILMSLTLKCSDCVFWTDSTIVLGWITSSPLQLKTFVRHRVCEIQELCKEYKWRYVPSRENPADLVSRGLSANELGSSSLWWSGPQFLQSNEINWPANPNTSTNINLPEMVVKSLVVVNNTSDSNPLSELITHTSSFFKLRRVGAYILRFIYNCKHKLNERRQSFLSNVEMHAAEKIFLKIAQSESFAEERILLLAKKSLPPKNRLRSLSPFCDEDNIIRVGGRLANSSYDYNVQHPILISSKHHLCKLIFEMVHQTSMHAGPLLLLATVRHKYWAIGGRNLAKKVVHSCVKCCRFNEKIIQPVMGNLPKQRIELEFPFLESGVDYAGPIMISNRKGKGSSLIKSYICAFVCLATKALHLELVSDMTKESYIAALNRFIARRGKPRTLFSDNGTTFQGTFSELTSVLTKSLATDVTEKGINFSFIPAYTPHFGGLWESAIKSIKYHLKRILDLTHLTYEEMSTLLTQVEAILNSRPLTPLSDDPNDLYPLTPAHFLIGRSINFVPHPQISNAKVTSLQRWKRIEYMKQHFWDRFANEYILWLQQKTKWHHSRGELKVGTLVVVKDKALPPLLWLLGRVIRVIPGGDGVARVADITTKKGVIRRAFNNIVPLPVPSVEVIKK